MLLLIDNFDSFTYNLVHYFAILGEEVRVVRNNALTAAECIACLPDYIVLSPGPGHPAQAGITADVIRLSEGRIPILGICLGMQAIAEVYGGKVIRSGKPVHGKSSKILHTDKGVFTGLPQEFAAVRYHSLIVDGAALPSCLEATAHTDDGTIMGIRHRTHLVEGVQFHPESIMTEGGFALLKNFLETGHKG